MAIAGSDVLYKYSIKTGSAGNSTASAAATSLGKYISTTDVATGLNGLFDDVSAAENAASTVDYRSFFVRNNHGSLTMQNTVIYLASETAGGTNIAIAIDNTAASVIGSASAQGDQIANETTAPSAVGAFSSPTTAGTGLSLGNIPAGQCRQVWVKRTATNSLSQADGVTLEISFETAP
jgi:hypothetical protein